MRIEFRSTGDQDFIGFIQRNFVVQVFLDDESTATLTWRDRPGGGYEIWQRGGEARLKVTGIVTSSVDGSMSSWGDSVTTGDGWLVFENVEVEIYNPAVPGELLYRMPVFNAYKGSGSAELPFPYLIGMEENLLRLLYNFFATLANKSTTRSLNKHIQKLDVAAGDHCLSSDEVPRDEVWVVTNVCTKLSCDGASQVRTSRNYMNNIFTIQQQQNPAAGELMCQGGSWILYGGEFIQSCFTDVPEGCDLHLYISGTQRAPEEYMDLLGLTVGWPAPLGWGLPWTSFGPLMWTQERFELSGQLNRVHGVVACELYETYSGTMYLRKGDVDIDSISFTTGQANPVSFSFKNLVAGTYTLLANAANIVEFDCSGGPTLDFTVGPSQQGIEVKYIRWL